MSREAEMKSFQEDRIHVGSGGIGKVGWHEAADRQLFPGHANHSYLFFFISLGLCAGILRRLYNCVVVIHSIICYSHSL